MRPAWFLMALFGSALALPTAHADHEVGHDRAPALVSHSLGVTLARKTLTVNPDLRTGLRAFVGIAGANHGTSLCVEGTQGVLHSCSEIAAGTDWLADLNGPDGQHETFGPERWLTLYDGTGVNDVAFLGPDYAESPRLEGADDRAVADQHNDLRIAPANIELYRVWLESVLAEPTTDPVPRSDAAPTADPGRTGPSRDADTEPALPATGGRLRFQAVVLLAMAGVGLRLVSRHARG